MNSLLAYDPGLWIMEQPMTRFSVDAKCLLARLIDPDQLLGSSLFHEKLLDVRRSRLSDGSFESKYGGGRGSVLWTADAIGWLHLAAQPDDITLFETAVDWLAARQRADGSWLEDQRVPWGRVWYHAPAAHVWITSAILQSLRDGPESVRPLVEHGFAFLMKALGQFASLASARAPQAAYDLFGFDFFSLAVCIETFLGYGRPMPVAAEICTYLIRAQAQDGSWSSSIDVTQSAANGLLLLTDDPELPALQAALRFLAQQQNQDGSWSHQPGERGDWTLTAYTARLFIRISRALGLPPPTNAKLHSNRELLRSA